MRTPFAADRAEIEGHDFMHMKVDNRDDATQDARVAYPAAGLAASRVLVTLEEREERARLDAAAL